MAVGAYAGNELANTIWNTAIGYHALETDTTGNENTVVGTSAFRNNADGIRNVSLGINTGYWATGDNNTYIGSYAGQGASGLSTGSANVGVGDYALTAITSGGQNVGIGESALGSTTTGNLNVAVGSGAKDQNHTGIENVAVGFWADRIDTSGSYNTAIGSKAHYFNYNRSHIVAVGDSALYQNGVTVSAANTLNGLRNTAVGSAALRFNNDGYNNTGIGYNALRSPNSGISNTAVGNNALVKSGGTGNSGLGDSALYTNLSGSYNSALGYNADVSVSNLTNATAIGAQALASQSNTVVLGSIAGLNGATTTVNVGIGETTPNARLHVTRNGASGGTYNVNSSMIIEDNASSYITLSNPNASENGILSGNASTSIKGGIIFRADSSIQIRAGGNTTRMTVDNNGFVGIGTTIPNYQLELSTNSAGKPGTSTWTISSDSRLKTIDGKYTKGLAEILKLNTIRYHYAPGNARNLPADEQEYGFTAQEVQKVFPEAVKTGKDGYLSLDLHPVFISYVNAIKEQQQQIEDLKKKNEQLEKDMQAIKAKLGINN